MKLDQLALPETGPLNTLFPYPSHTDGQTEKASRSRGVRISAEAPGARF
jgi:hypothetical protein